jgi:hypothetical protein
MSKYVPASSSLDIAIVKKTAVSIIQADEPVSFFLLSMRESLVASGNFKFECITVELGSSPRRDFPGRLDAITGSMSSGQIIHHPRRWRQPGVPGRIGSLPTTSAALLSHKEHPLPQIRAGIERYCNVIQFGWTYPTHLQTIPNRLRRKSCPMLNTIKALFFDGSHQFTIHNQGCRCVAVVGVNTQYILQITLHK